MSTHERKRPVNLDELDKAIITQLQRDGRMSYADLGQEIGMSPAATRQRVQRLLDSGTMQVVAVTDPTATGYPTVAMLGVRVSGDVRDVADAISELEGVIYIVMTSGSFDLMVEVIAEDPGSLLDLINDGIRALPAVETVESFLYFGIHTHRFGWGAR